MRVRLRVERLRRLLAESSLSQNHWAIKLGISRGHWSALVNGKHLYPSPRTRLRMLEIFGLRLDELFEVESGPTTWHDTDFRAALLERYLIDRELGQGAMGSVYLARDVAHGRLVAVKVLAPEAVCGVGVASFLREISLVSKLQHPNILPLFDSGVAAEHPFYVMPYVRGGSLRDRLTQETRLGLPAVTAIATGMAAALGYAHQEHVLHCDVKPANTLLYRDHPYVMDFGISRVLHAEASEWRARRGFDVSAGTPAYVSPEQANGDTDLDGRADVYSLGCVVYEMLTGRPPFEGASTEAIVAQRFLAPAPPIRHFAPEVPTAVAEAVERAMELERGRRPQTPAQFAEELCRAARGGRRGFTALSLGASRVVGSFRRRAGRQAAHSLGGRLMELPSDLRLTLRNLLRSPRFALAFVLPLALGLGAGATFFGIVDQVLYRPPTGVQRPEGLLRVAVANPRIPDPLATGFTSASWSDYDALRRHTTTLSGLAAFGSYRPSLGRGPGARSIPAMLTTASYFPLLGVHAQLGRFYQPEEETGNASLVPCVLSDRLWESDFGRAVGVLGKSLTVGRLRCTVVGVAPPGFHGLGYTPIDLWLPLRAAAWDSQGAHLELWTTDRSYWLRILARPKPGIAADAINADVTQAYRFFADRTRDKYLAGRFVTGAVLKPAGRAIPQRLRVATWLTGGSLALLLLVAANLVNLLVARNLGRARETAIRLALGGGRARLFRQHLLECLTLAVLAGAASMAVVWGVMPVVRETLFPGVDWAVSSVNHRIAVAAAIAAVFLGGIIAGFTAWHAGRANPASLLNGAGTRVAGSKRQRIARLGLVTVQAALSMLLLVASTGFVRSFRTAAGTNLGYNIDGLILAEVELALQAVDSTSEGRRRGFLELRDRLASLPGVAGASLGYMGPWWNNRTEKLVIPGRDSVPPVPGFDYPLFDAVTPEYLQTLGMRLTAGRWIAPTDRDGTAPVMVVNQALAEHYWPGERSIVGRCIIVDAPRLCREIVGVVANHRVTGALDTAPIPAYFLPFAQAAEYRVSARIFIRARGNAAALVPTIRREIQGFRAGLPATDVHLLQEQLDPLLAPWRLGAMAFTALGLLAALISMLGLFSVLAYLVAERRREFAIRGALGAQSGQILGPVVRQGLLVVASGALIGGVLAWPSARWLQPLLFQVRLLEPVVLAVVLLGLLVMALLASLGPARSAAKLDPMEVLRAE